MKKAIIILLSVFPLIVSAQVEEGSIYYEEVTKIEVDFKSDEVDMELVKSMIPSSSTSKKELVFTGAHSIYRNAKNENEEADGNFESQSEGISIKVMRSKNTDELYFDHRNQTTIERRDFMGRTFLISGDQEKQKWKIAGERKEIAGYQCQKATLQKDSANIVAWFTPQIQISSGPDGYGNLPGMILELDVENGRNLIKATEVKLGQSNSSEITPPKKGKSVTKEEFEGIVEEKMKEMGDVQGGSGTFRVIRRN